MKEAAFALKNYSVIKANLNLVNVLPECTFNIDFKPSGVYYPNSGEFLLSLDFTASYKKNETEEEDAVNVTVLAEFQFKNKPILEEIPNYFYSNSIAIIFPYVRAFVSTITLQANVSPIMLPTFNMSALDSILKENTIVKR